MRDALNILRGIALAPALLVICSFLVVFGEEHKKPWRPKDAR